jgi:hypothetical protein
MKRFGAISGLRAHLLPLGQGLLLSAEEQQTKSLSEHVGNLCPRNSMVDSNMISEISSTSSRPEAECFQKSCCSTCQCTGDGA